MLKFLLGAELLVEGNVFTGGSKKAIFSTDDGFAVARNNDFGGATNTAANGKLTTVPYKLTILATNSVKARVQANAGQKLSF